MRKQWAVSKNHFHKSNSKQELTIHRKTKYLIIQVIKYKLIKQMLSFNSLKPTIHERTICGKKLSGLSRSKLKYEFIEEVAHCGRPYEWLQLRDG